MKLIVEKNKFTDEHRAELKKLIDKKYGVETTIKHYRGNGSVTDHIYDITGNVIGSSTLERLVGLNNNNVYPSKNTLNIVAQYLNLRNPEYLIKYLDNKINNTKKDYSKFSNASLFKKYNFKIVLKDDKLVELKHNYDNNYTVVNTENIKLLPNDTIEISFLELGSSFCCSSVKRKNIKPISLGGYSSNDSTVINISFVK